MIRKPLESVYSFHLAQVGLGTTARALSFSSSKRAPGLQHAECMTVMTLGAPIFSPRRMQLGNLAMFAAWESEGAIDHFLKSTKLGQAFSSGWHVRMKFSRRWGSVSEVDGLPENGVEIADTDPVVAVTLARMRLPEIPRFIRWGKPVEELVRDHPGKTLALASLRLPRTVSTFTIWRTQQEMRGMVFGHSKVAEPKRHAVAMKERERKNFHFEFTTLRFKPLAEYGEWKGKTKYLP